MSYRQVYGSGLRVYCGRIGLLGRGVDQLEQQRPCKKNGQIVREHAHEASIYHLSPHLTSGF